MQLPSTIIKVIITIITIITACNMSDTNENIETKENDANAPVATAAPAVSAEPAAALENVDIEGLKAENDNLKATNEELNKRLTANEAAVAENTKIVAGLVADKKRQAAATKAVIEPVTNDQSVTEHRDVIIKALYGDTVTDNTPL